MKRFIPRLLSFFFLFIFIPQLPAAAVYAADSQTAFADAEASADTPQLPEFPELSSSKVVVMDADSQEILYEENGHIKCYPASTTKLLTALLTIESCTMDEVVTYSQAAVDSVEYGDANASISVGEQLTLEQSLYCLLLRSANDVAYGLAEHVAGSIPAFSDMMNARLSLLGCNDTHFNNPSGLHDANHYTTPYDMALIANACFQNKTLMHILSYTGVYTIPPTNTNSFTRYYTARFQMLSDGEYPYPYALGGKTGYTDAAGNCLVTFAQKDDLRLICVIMDSGEVTRYKDTIALFDYYFNNYHKTYLKDEASVAALTAGTDADAASILSLTAQLSATHGFTIGFKENSYLLIPNGFSLSDLDRQISYAEDENYIGPAGSIACIRYYADHTNIANAAVYAIPFGNTDPITGLDGVPLRSYQTGTSAEGFTYIHIWYLIFAFVILCIIVVLILLFFVNFGHEPRPHYKKLRF